MSIMRLPVLNRRKPWCWGGQPLIRTSRDTVAVRPWVASRSAHTVPAHLVILFTSGSKWERQAVQLPEADACTDCCAPSHAAPGGGASADD